MYFPLLNDIPLKWFLVKWYSFCWTDYMTDHTQAAQEYSGAFSVAISTKMLSVWKLSTGNRPDSEILK